MDLKEEQILGSEIDRHWYYRSKARALKRLLPKAFNRRIVDIGAGSGYFSRYLARNGLIDQACCIDVGYPADRQEQFFGAEICYTSKPRKTGAGVALFMDVLEHVEDDVALLRSYREFLSSNATAIITVPAFQFLWSGHDLFLEHHRRYTIASLNNTIARAGYFPVHIFYYYGVVFPAAMMMRLFSAHRDEARSNLKIHSRFVNSILYGSCRFELPFMKFNHLFGLSVCAICLPRRHGFSC